MLEVIDFGARSETRLEKAMRLGRSINMHSPSGQDSAATNSERTAFAVADGVASDPNAATAAEYATNEFVAAFADRYSSHDDVLSIIHDGLLDHLHKVPALVRATTTLTGVVITQDNYASYLHLGDSQLLLRRNDEVSEVTSEQVIRGHSLTNYLGVSGKWPPGYTRHPLNLHAVPNQFSLTGKEAEWRSVALEAGDRLILATEGVLGSDPLERKAHKDWCEQTRRSLGAQAVADMLVRKSPKIDDSTALVIDIG